MPGTWTRVDTIPDCDFHPGTPAYADAKTRGGPWAYVCRGCFTTHSCSLGTGRGQELLLRAPMRAESEQDKHEFQEGWDSV